MCSRYQSPDAAELARHYRMGTPDLTAVKPMNFPGYTVPALIQISSGELKIEPRFWGFVLNLPGKKDPSKTVSKILQNAVSETVDEKRTFSKAWVNSRRCILPATTFFEPIDGQFTGIVDPQRKIMSIAGIWAEQTYRENHVQACTMLTCEPSAQISKFHDRMPVILHPEDVSEWLSPDTPPEQAKKLCRPWRGELEILRK